MGILCILSLWGTVTHVVNFEIPLVSKLFIFLICPTMPAKSLGTLAMIYAIVELQNPLPRKTILWKGDMNVSASTSDTFLQR